MAQVLKPLPMPVVKVHCGLTSKQKELMKDLKSCIDTPMGSCDPTHVLRVAGFRYIGEGAYRRAYHYADRECVLKVAKGPEGRRHMVGENEAWEMSKGHPELRALLTPVHAEDPQGYWNTMPAAQRKVWRAGPISTGDEAVLDDAQIDRTRLLLLHLLRTRGWFCDDLHHGNVGRLGTRPVAIDYGFGCERLSKRAQRWTEFDWEELPGVTRGLYGGREEAPKFVRQQTFDDWKMRQRERRVARKRSHWF